MTAHLPELNARVRLVKSYDADYATILPGVTGTVVKSDSDGITLKLDRDQADANAAASIASFVEAYGAFEATLDDGSAAIYFYDGSGYGHDTAVEEFADITEII